MFDKDDRLFYIDLTDGAVLEGRFIEYDSNGLWIRIKGQSANTFVYSDMAGERVFRDMDTALAELDNIRRRTKTRLSDNDRLIEDILSRLEKHEGSFYTGIIKEILSEKLK